MEGTCVLAVSTHAREVTVDGHTGGKWPTARLTASATRDPEASNPVGQGGGGFLRTIGGMVDVGTEKDRSKNGHSHEGLVRCSRGASWHVCYSLGRSRHFCLDEVSFMTNVSVMTSMVWIDKSMCVDKTKIHDRRRGGHLKDGQ